MVEKLDLPEPEDIGQVRADREQARVKSRRRRVPNRGCLSAMGQVAFVEVDIVVAGASL